MPELVLETKQEKSGEEKGVGARVCVFFVAYIHGVDPMCICR